MTLPLYFNVELNVTVCLQHWRSYQSWALEVISNLSFKTADCYLNELLHRGLFSPLEQFVYRKKKAKRKRAVTTASIRDGEVHPLKTSSSL